MSESDGQRTFLSTRERGPGHGKRPGVRLAARPGGTPLRLEKPIALKISSAIFDEVAAERGRSLDHFNVPEPEKREALAAFDAHKGDVTEGYSQ
jgi:hemoglobin